MAYVLKPLTAPKAKAPATYGAELVAAVSATFPNVEPLYAAIALLANIGFSSAAVLSPVVIPMVPTTTPARISAAVLIRRPTLDVIPLPVAIFALRSALACFFFCHEMLSPLHAEDAVVTEIIVRNLDT